MTDKLTPKQEAFCQAYIETGNASEAYRRSYDSDKMSDGAIRVEASRLLSNPNVALTIKKLKQQLDDLALVSLKDHLERLETLSKQAEAAGQFNAAITAETNRGKACGLYIDRVDNTSSDGSMSPQRIVFEVIDDAKNTDTEVG